MRLRKAEHKRITFALFAIIIALTLVQCIFVVDGTAVAETSYRELVPDYFSFGAPTRIAACGEDFAVFDRGKVTVFSGNNRTTFETGVESCDKLALSTDGVFVLTGLSGDPPAPSILCFNLDGTSKTYVIPSDNVTDISVAGGKVYTLSGLLHVNAYNVSDGALAENFDLQGMAFSVYLAADDGVIYFRKYDGKVIQRQNGELTAAGEVGEVALLAAHGGKLYYAKDDEIRILGETTALLRRGTGDAAFASVTDFAAGNHLYVLDGEHHAVKIYTYDGRFEKMIGSYGTDAGRLNSPVALTVRGGKILVADSLRGTEFAGNTVRTLKSRQVVAPTDIAVTDNAVYLADNGILYEYNSSLVLSNPSDHSFGTSPCKYVTASPNGTVFASSGREVYVKKAGENSFKKLLTAEREIEGMNVGIGGNILYLLSGTRISAYAQSGEVIGELDAQVAVNGFAVDYRGDVYVTSANKKLYKFERVLEGYAAPRSYDLPAAYGAFSDVALDESGRLYVIADHNVLIYPKATFSVFVKEDATFEDNVPSVDPRFVCEVAKESVIAYASPGNFEDISIISRGERLMCYATVDYAGDTYVRAETEKGTKYLALGDVTVFDEGAAPFRQARCLIAAIGSNVVGVDIYREPSFLAIEKGVEPLFADLGKDDIFNVVSIVAVDQAGKDVWGFYRVEYQGTYGYVRADEVVSPDDDPPPAPKTYELQVKSDGLGKTVAVYKEASTDSEIIASLSDGSKIKALEELDNEKEFTMVLYEGEVCYVLTANLSRGGLSGGQILAIVLTVVAAVGSVFTILILRANKKHKRSQKE